MLEVQNIYFNVFQYIFTFFLLFGFDSYNTYSTVKLNSLMYADAICLELFHQPTLMHNFLYSLTMCLLHYYPRHVSSINMPIFRRTNCIITASDIVTLCKWLFSIPDENRLHVNAQNMSMIVM